MQIIYIYIYINNFYFIVITQWLGQYIAFHNNFCKIIHKIIFCPFKTTYTFCKLFYAEHQVEGTVLIADTPKNPKPKIQQQNLITL
jgi:hypothetical protein